MNMNDYQKEALRTAAYPDIGNNFIYPVLGLNGEAGEVAEKIKKVIRDNNAVIDAEAKEALKKEMGDVLWYLAALCHELGLSLDDVAASNIKKLRDRQERDAIHGKGDNR
ncbi:MAG: nucleoside triphosphate pyrophosphohydrolase family protein [bacterium]|nr:nucleoside triphosphate pyrophosphohydrolase family protein [bacterium]